MGNGPSSKSFPSFDPDGHFSTHTRTHSSDRKLIVDPRENAARDNAISQILAQASLNDSATTTLRSTSLEGPSSTAKLPTVFRWEGGGKDVALSGSFNNWRKTIPMVKSEHCFYTIVELPVGEHEYKFFIDGEWYHDPSQKTTVNSFETENNLIVIKADDFDVMEALSQDVAKAQALHKRARRRSQPLDNFFRNSESDDLFRPRAKSPPGDYGQIVPDDPAKTDPSDVRVSTPPLLPPHLSQVLLNQLTNASCDPILLPYPNHVMLNHLYALSIKDGCIVLSCIIRYRHKFISTVVYKPI